MTSFFPTLYPDELLYSAIARYHQRSGNISWKHTAVDLFDTQSVTISVDLPARIESLVDNVPYSGSTLAEEFIWKHTLYPYYTTFQSNERRRQIKESMLSHNGGDIYSRAGIMASTIKTKSHLCYCPSCVEEDFVKYGETYWRRSHQLPGVFLCQKHQHYLLTCPMPIKSTNKYQALLTNDCINASDNMDGMKRLIASMNFEKHQLDLLISFCNLSYQLLDEKWIWKKIGASHESYKGKLYEIGYANVNGHVRQKKFLNEFVNYFGNKFLSLMQCDIDVEASTNWLVEIIRKPQKATHPVRHILVMQFLGISFQELACAEGKIKPFGNGPWPCLNVAANHYKEPVIENVRVTIDAKAKKVVGTFLCKCGFEYCRSGPDGDEIDLLHIGRVKSFGKVWEDQLNQLIEKKLTLREISRRMSVDPKTVERQAIILHNELHWKKTSDSMAVIYQKMSKRKEGENLTMKNSYREQWQQAAQCFPELTKTELRYKYCKIYGWLYRNDRKWIINFNSHKKPSLSINPRVDWKLRDKELLISVKKIIEELLSNHKRPVRITVNRIGKEIGKQMLLQKHPDKLPNTIEYISAMAASQNTDKL
ncbi:TnsD family transposase [Anoxynatronum buryatiense]|uniref:TniQ protein n=1 Tax=Anoxynatronum buryatiense TaxID=489973 RepID=A0AA46AKP3_9CLOT|nr:TnsD family transposase [Anoxynatronum buryatiense]SMP71997.1 TniQ protein [Anoxynatronum buryatiense]